MNKLMASLFLGLGLLVLGSRAEATSIKGAKNYTTTAYSTTVSTVAASGPAVVYGVILSTGTGGTDYTVLWDKAVVGATVISTTSGLVAKVVVSSTTQNTVYTFDPPLQFNNGVVVANSAATNISTVIWEKGRLAGQ